ncbi:hypothetical protein GOBAR_AA15370 [Gossypium barbadense]|uniref:BHLH domain-containing protein n=1 Tax=Gossypium barbadense TaxID=3634 RepID=A0A2P5XPM9_GOSBA|nr:hypothetical protein GOBAR_AA15370 [Gossypium barbadense]
MDASRNSPLELPDHFEPYDFVEDPNFDQLVNLIQGETEDVVSAFDYDLINGCFDDKQTGGAPGNAFEFDATSTMVPDFNYAFNALPSFDGEIMNDGEEDSDEEDERGQIKEKLYALRSLVPNITKMDKKSIIGDAVLYVQDLQMQAKKLKAEITGLEALMAGYQEESINNPVKIRVARNNHPICKKILKLDMFQVEERVFYVRLVCNKSEGVALSLYKALESLSNFKIQNSNLATVSDTFALTFTLNVRDREQSMNLANMKLWSLRVTPSVMRRNWEGKRRKARRKWKINVVLQFLLPIPSKSKRKALIPSLPKAVARITMAVHSYK